MQQNNTLGSPQKWDDSAHASLCRLRTYLREIGFSNLQAVQIVIVVFQEEPIDPAPELWRGETLGYTLSEGEQDHAKSSKDVYTRV